MAHYTLYMILGLFLFCIAACTRLFFATKLMNILYESDLNSWDSRCCLADYVIYPLDRDSLPHSWLGFHACLQTALLQPNFVLYNYKIHDLPRVFGQVGMQR